MFIPVPLVLALNLPASLGRAAAGVPGVGGVEVLAQEGGAGWRWPL